MAEHKPSRAAASHRGTHMHPTDILLFVFRLLNNDSARANCRLTCKSWAAAGLLVPTAVGPTNEECAALSGRFPNVRQFSFMVHPSPCGFLRYLQQVPPLRRLELSLPDGDLLFTPEQRLAAGSAIAAVTALTHLHIVNLETLDGLSALRQLRCLVFWQHLVQHRTHRPVSLKALLPAPQLRLLEVDILDTVALQDLDACASMPCLRSLKLTAENKECNDPALTVQVAAAKQLTALDFHAWPTDAAAKAAVLMRLTALRSLRLPSTEYCRGFKLDQSGMSETIRQLSRLRSARVHLPHGGPSRVAPHASGTAEVALQILGALAALTTLTALRITCTGGQLPTCQCSWELLGEAPGFRGLQALELHGSDDMQLPDIGAQAASVTQAANASLARLTQLTLLEASRALLPMPEVGAMPGCAQLRIAASVKIDTLAALTALERLDLDGAGVTRPVDAGAVMAPLQMGPGNDDDLAGRPDCAAAFVRRLGRLLPALGRLRALRVRGGPARYGAGYDSRSDEFLATDAAIECIAAGAPQLTYLALQRCAGLSDAGLAALAPLTRLETLIITGGDATFSKVGIAAAFRRPALPELRFLDLMPPAVPSTFARTFELPGVPGRRFERWPRGGGHAAMNAAGHGAALQPVTFPWEAPPLALSLPRVQWEGFQD